LEAFNELIDFWKEGSSLIFTNLVGELGWQGGSKVIDEVIYVALE